MGAQRVRWRETGGLSEEGLDVLLTKEVRGPWPSLATKEPCWWHLMTRVFSVTKAGEPDDHAQTVKPRRAPAFGPARHWRFAGGAFTPPLTKGMLTPPWNPSIRFPALTGGA